MPIIVRKIGRESKSEEASRGEMGGLLSNDWCDLNVTKEFSAFFSAFALPFLGRYAWSKVKDTKLDEDLLWTAKRAEAENNRTLETENDEDDD